MTIFTFSTPLFLYYYFTPKTEDGGFTSKVFRKRIYTGLILNFSALFPQKLKFGLIQCLLHRAYTVSSSWVTFSQEADFLKDVFSQNGYPEDLFTSCLTRFVNNKYCKSLIFSVPCI